MDNGWVDVNDKMPNDELYYLVRAPSGYISIDYRYSEAKFSLDRNAWVDCSFDRITNSGGDVTHWREFP